MSIPELPKELLVDIVRRVGSASYLDLGPILRAGKKGKKLVFKKEVLATANIDDMCSDPSRIFCASFRSPYIFPPGSGRCFFEKCLHQQNPTAIYFESLRLVSREQDLNGALAMLANLVPYYPAPTFAYAMLLICAGKSEAAGDVFKIFFDEHASAMSLEISVIGEKVVDDIKGFYPPSHDTFGDTWRYPSCEAIDFPECASWHNYRISCEDCYLFWCSMRIRDLL